MGGRNWLCRWFWVVVSPCWASYFFLLVQKEVTKKKDTRFRSRFPLRSNRSPVRFAAGGASGNSPYRAQTPARFSRQLLQCSAAPTGLSILRALVPALSGGTLPPLLRRREAQVCIGLERAMFESRSVDSRGGRVAQRPMQTEHRREPEGRRNRGPFFLPTSFWARKKKWVADRRNPN